MATTSGHMPHLKSSSSLLSSIRIINQNLMILMEQMHKTLELEVLADAI